MNTGGTTTVHTDLTLLVATGPEGGGKVVTKAWRAARRAEIAVAGSWGGVVTIALFTGLLIRLPETPDATVRAALFFLAGDAVVAISWVIATVVLYRRYRHLGGRRHV
jgi:hypothetical protein